MNLPSLSTPFVDQDGRLNGPWVDLISALAGGQVAPSEIELQGSGFPIAARAGGHFIVNGGAVTGITIIRGRPATSVLMGITRGPVPVSKGDLMAVTYSAAPVVTFLPS